VLGGGSNSSSAVGGDVFRRAPFLTSQQQPFRVSSATHQRQQYPAHQRPARTSAAATAFVNTSFQGDDTLRLD